MDLKDCGLAWVLPNHLWQLLLFQNTAIGQYLSKKQLQRDLEAISVPSKMYFILAKCERKGVLGLITILLGWEMGPEFRETTSFHGQLYCF